MRKGFSLIEMIISITLLSLVGIFSFFVIKKAELTYADPYEELRLLISDATNVYLNSTNGYELKEELYDMKKISLNSNLLIQEGLIEDNYFLKNLGERKDLKNIEIIISVDDEGFINYSINID